jgi:membrane protease YdiL (CAAX protease family)
MRDPSLQHHDEAVRILLIGKWAPLYVLIFILVALTEEFSARGYALYTLTSIAGFWPAAILMALKLAAPRIWKHCPQSVHTGAGHARE